MELVVVGRESRRSVVRRTIEAQSLGESLYFTALIVFVLFLALYLSRLTFVEQVCDLHTPCSIYTKAHASHNAVTPHERADTGQ